MNRLIGPRTQQKAVPLPKIQTGIPPAPMSVAQKNQIANNKHAAEEAARLRRERAR